MDLRSCRTGSGLRDASGVDFANNSDYILKEDNDMLRKARIITMICLAGSVVLTAGLVIANLVLACLDLAKPKERWH